MAALSSTAGMDRLVAEAVSQPGGTSAAALSLVKKILDNLVAHPGDEKYSRLRLSGKAGQKLTAAPTSISALQELGFAATADGEFLAIDLDLATVDGAAAPAIVAAATSLAEAVPAAPAAPAAGGGAATAAPVLAPVSSNKSTAGMSLKQKALFMKEQKAAEAREKAAAVRAEELAKLKQDAYVRQHDENWTSGVSAAAGKGGTSIGTFREKFGEDKGG